MEGGVGGGSGSARPSGQRKAPGQLSGLGLWLGMILLLLAGRTTAAAQTAPPTYDELLAKAARQGTLRVIVEVLPDGPAPPTREAIAHAQDRVLQELAGTDHRVLRRYATIPFLGLAVSADALRRLAGSLFVGGIREDMVLRPQRSPGSP